MNTFLKRNAVVCVAFASLLLLPACGKNTTEKETAKVEPKALAVYGPTNPEGQDAIQRYGSIIELLPEKEQAYRKLHADCWPKVCEMIHRCNIKNYNIFIATIQGKRYLFSYFEYHGADFEADMTKMAADSNTQKWWKETDPCQRKLPGTPDGKQWTDLERVFFLE